MKSLWALTVVGMFIIVSVYAGDGSILVESYNPVHVNHAENTMQFYGEAHSDLYVVEIYSPHKMFVKDFSFSVLGNISGLTYVDMAGGIVMNTTHILYLNPFSSYITKRGVQYFHFKFGKLNYTFDNRVFENWSSCHFKNTTLYWEKVAKNFTLTPGKWYFIAFACWEDEKLDTKEIKIKMWINFSNCKDLKISSSYGKINTWWYGAFDSSFILYHFPFLSMMIRGKINFHVNNTLVYFFMPYPDSKGIMITKWKYPDGRIGNDLIVNLHGITIGKNRLYGMGKNGDYELEVSYWDRESLEWRNVVINGRWITANILGFVAIDLNLVD